MQQRVRNFSFCFVKKELIILVVSFCLQTETLLKVEGETYTRFVNVIYEHEYCKKNGEKIPLLSENEKVCAGPSTSSPESSCFRVWPRGP